MRINEVQVPPHFTYKCIKCEQRFTTDRTPAWADLDGEPFKAYYCQGCKVALKLHIHECQDCGHDYECAQPECAGTLVVRCPKCQEEVRS